MKIGRRYAIIFVIFLIFAVWNLFFLPTVQDTLFWPRSAHQRIEEYASILRRIGGPAKWCYPSRHSDNLLKESPDLDAEAEMCIASIEPASDFIALYPDYYIRRHYRASTETYICEVTLSTVRNNDRTAGSDCYYGLFRKEEEPIVGVTDDPFG